MSDNPQDKKDTVPDVPSAKSYSTDGATAEFDPGALQVHAISPELRQQMSGDELPRLDPKYLQDTAPPNRHAVTSAAVDPATATTQPSLRRLQMAAPVPTTGRRRGLPIFFALLVFAIAWEVVVLVRTRTNVEISGALPRTAETTEPAAGQNPEPAREPARAAELPASPSPPAQPESSAPPATAAAERAPAARNSNLAASSVRAPALAQDVEPVHQETNVPPKPEGVAAPQPASSAKSQSKVLFPPQ